MPPSMSEIRPDREPLVGAGQIDHHVADFTATMAADVPLRVVQETLARQGQWLPIDGDAERPVGELVETNSTGPLRLGYGAWRDLLLGAQFTNGRGELITAGGRTVKNVAGYDLTKFMVGQRGVFGTLVTLTTRAYKRPAGAIMATFGASPKLIQRLIPSPQKPQWALLTADALHCGYVGDERALAYYESAVRELQPRALATRSLDEDITHRAALWRGDFRAAVPPARVAEFVAAAGLDAWVADPAFGIVLGSGGDDAAIRRAANDLQGTVLFSRPGQATAGAADGGWFDVPPGPQRELLERLKRSFDPDGRLAPLPWTAPRSTNAAGASAI
jgi:FAD/FMN-containing dehydrogenase